MRLVGLSEKENRLFLACITGNDNSVEVLLREGIDANIKYDDRGNNMLMLACSKDNKKIIEYLIEYGANINEKNSIGETALMIAARVMNDNIDAIKLLIEKGADINEKDNMNETVLMRACMAGKLEVVKLLIEKGADIDAIDNKGDTALKIACKNENLEIIREILDNRASLNNLNQEEVDFITDNLSKHYTIKILSAIANRDFINIDNYLNEYCINRNKDIKLIIESNESIDEYKDHLKEYYKANEYLNSLKNSKEFNELRLETKDLKEQIAKTEKYGCNSGKIIKINKLLERNKKVLKSIRTFENNINDIVGIKILRPIYSKKEIRVDNNRNQFFQ